MPFRPRLRLLQVNCPPVPVLVLVLLAGCARPVPLPPSPNDLSTLDPTVAELIQKITAEVAEDPRDPSRLIGLGMAYEANDLHQLASLTYVQVLDRDPRNHRVWFRQAVCLEREGELEAAIDAMNRSIELHSGFAASHWRKSMWELDAGRIGSADAEADIAIGLDPTDASAWFAKAQVELVRGNNQEAINIVEDRGLERLVNGPLASFLVGRAYQQLGKAAAALPYLQEHQQQQGYRPTWRDDWSRELDKYHVGIARDKANASSLVKRGDFPKAIPILESILQREPEDMRTLNMLAFAYFRTQRFSESFKVLEHGLRRNPESFSTNLNSASLALSARAAGAQVDIEKALSHAKKAVELRPQNSKAQEALAQAQRWLGKHDLAIASFERAQALDARTPRSGLQAAQVELDNGRPSEAIDRLVQLEERYRESPYVHLALAAAWSQQGDYDRARRALEVLQALPKQSDTASTSIEKAVAGLEERFPQLRAVDPVRGSS